MRVAVTTAALCVAVASVAAEPRGLTRAEVKAAIAFGEQGALQPYLLRHQGRPENPVVVGAVYTPFLRVAYLARAAAHRGERFTSDDVDGRETAPIVLVAFRWYADASDAADALAAAEPQVVMLPLAPQAPPYVRFTKDVRLGAVAPLWSRKGTASHGAFGAPDPYDDIALVAAFPAHVIEAGRPFAIYKDTERVQSIRVGVVRADDAAAWR